MRGFRAGYPQDDATYIETPACPQPAPAPRHAVVRPPESPAGIAPAPSGAACPARWRWPETHPARLWPSLHNRSISCRIADSYAQAGSRSVGDFMNQGDGLVIGVSIMSASLTSFMSDGATVGALVPLALPMSELGQGVCLESGANGFLCLLLRQRAGGGDAK